MSEALSPVGNLVAAAHVGIGPVGFVGKTFGFESVVLNGTAFELRFAANNHIAVDDRVVIATPVVSAPAAAILITTAGLSGGNSEDGIQVFTWDSAGDPEGNAFYVLVFRKAVGGG